MVRISDIIESESVVFLDGGTREEVIKTLARTAYTRGKIPSEESFEKDEGWQNFDEA